MRSRDGQQKVCVACEANPVESFSATVKPVILQKEYSPSSKKNGDHVHRIVECLAELLENGIGHKSQSIVDFDSILKAIQNFHSIYKVKYLSFRFIKTFFSSRMKFKNDS